MQQFSVQERTPLHKRSGNTLRYQENSTEANIETY